MNHPTPSAVSTKRSASANASSNANDDDDDDGEGEGESDGDGDGDDGEGDGGSDDGSEGASDDARRYARAACIQASLTRVSVTTAISPAASRSNASAQGRRPRSIHTHYQLI